MGDARGRDGVGDDEFFIGYLPQAPPRLARFVRTAVACVLAALLGGGALMLAGQGPFRPSRFEFGEAHRWSGVLREHPQPLLEVRRPGLAAAGELVSRFLLVAQGKHGAQALCAGLDGRDVSLSGALVYRGGQVMLELAEPPLAEDAPVGLPGEPPRARSDAPEATLDASRGGADADTAATAGAAARLPGVESLGEVELVGQIVDSKCYFGVMNPADSTSHRACAERCLSGGIPALLRVRAADGTELTPLLTGRDGRALNRELLDRVAVPVSVRGTLEREGDLLLLRTEPADVARLPPR